MSNNSAPLAGIVSQAILGFRFVILAVFTLLLGVLGYSATQFKIDASADTLLTKDNKLFIETQLANRTFSPDEFILVAYQPRSKKVFTQQTMDDLQTLSQGFAEMERVDTLNSILNVPLIQTKEQFISGQKMEALTYEKQGYSPTEMGVLLDNHPIYTDLLVNRAQDATAIQIVFKVPPKLIKLNNQITGIQAHLLTRELTEEEQLKLHELQRQANKIEDELGKTRQDELEHIEHIISDAELDAKVFIGGSYVVGIRLVEIVKQDLRYFGLGIIAFISLLLLALFRQIRWVLFPIFACATSVAITMGVLALLKLPATVISANFIALQLILTLAIMLHLITYYRDVSRQQPELNQHQRILKTLTSKLAPCFFAALTTSVGFGSLIFSGIQPVIDFGKMMLISNLVTLAVALLVFPALLSFLSPHQETSEYQWMTNGLGHLANLVKKHTKTCIFVPLAIMLGISLGIAKLNVENSFIDYFHPDTKVHQELAFIDQEFGGSTPLDIIIQYGDATEQSSLFMSAEQVNTLHLGHAAVDAFSATGNVTSLINFTTLAKQLNNNQPITEYELDVIHALASQQVVDNLVGAYIDTDSQTMRISTRIEDTQQGLNRAELLTNLESDLVATGLSPQQFQLTNLFVLYQDILSRLFESQITTLGIVYLVIGIVLVAIFRSIKLALIALVPNILTTTTILGIIGWAGIPLDLMTITIAAIAMGIAIDDTIHFVDAYVTHQQEDKMQRAFSHTGLAIVYTSTLIAAGFGMFVFSDFMPSVYFGVLTACAMIMAIVTDLTILPALLKRYTSSSN